MRRKAELFSTPIPSKSLNQGSFLSFSPSSISVKLSSLGVSLGKNEKEVVLSANVLKHVEYDRRKVSPSVSIKPFTSHIDDDEANDTLDGQLLSHLVGEVSEVDLDDGMLGSFDDLYATTRRSKSAKNKRNRSARKSERKSKNPIVSQ